MRAARNGMPRRGSDLRHSRSLVSLKSVRIDSVADLVADTTAGFCLNSIRASFARKGPADFVTLCGAMDIGAGLADMCVVVDEREPGGRGGGGVHVLADHFEHAGDGEWCLSVTPRKCPGVPICGAPIRRARGCGCATTLRLLRTGLLRTDAGRGLVRTGN